MHGEVSILVQAHPSGMRLTVRPDTYIHGSTAYLWEQIPLPVKNLPILFGHCPSLTSPGTLSRAKGEGVILHIPTRLMSQALPLKGSRLSALLHRPLSPTTTSHNSILLYSP